MVKWSVINKSLPIIISLQLAQSYEELIYEAWSLFIL